MVHHLPTGFRRQRVRPLEIDLKLSLIELLSYFPKLEIRNSFSSLALALNARLKQSLKGCSSWCLQVVSSGEQRCSFELFGQVQMIVRLIESAWILYESYTALFLRLGRRRVYVLVLEIWICNLNFA